MKNRRFIIAAALISLLCISAQAQDLKAVRDKTSGKYGYTGKKSKEWVIDPAFDRAGRFTKDGVALVVVGNKHGIITTDGSWLVEPLYDDVATYNKSGFSVLTNKEGRTRLRGAANLDGDIVMPVEYSDLDFDRDRQLIKGQIPVVTEDGQELGNAWGLYDFQGNELAEPQFKSMPSFNGNLAIVTSVLTNMKGVMDTNGKMTIQMDNLDVARTSSEYITLGQDFTVRFYDKTGTLYSVDRLPGSIYPYDVKDDDIRAITWHKMGVGERFHRNNIKLAERRGTSRNFVCTDVPVEWGIASSRFIRLELDETNKEGVPSMEDVTTGRRYTIAAYLYESDGSLVGCISEYGWFEGYSDEGTLYSAANGEQWLLLRDINAPFVRSLNISLPGFKPLDNSTVQSAFLLSNADKSILASFTRCRDLKYDILKMENAGITSYFPRPTIDARTGAAIRRSESWPIFRNAYAMGNVYTVKFGKDGSGKVVDDMPIIHYVDRIEDFSLQMECDEPIYWGPTNNWAIRLELESVPEPRNNKEKDALIIDDMFNSKKYFVLAVNMYDEHGMFVRNLGQSTRVGFAEDGSVILEELGLLFASPRARIRVGENVRMLPIPEKTMLSGFRESGIL